MVPVLRPASRRIGLVALFQQPGGGSGEIAGLYHRRNTLRMYQDATAPITPTGLLDIFQGEALVNGAVAIPENDFVLPAGGAVLPTAGDQANFLILQA